MLSISFVNLFGCGAICCYWFVVNSFGFWVKNFVNIKIVWVNWLVWKWVRSVPRGWVKFKR